MNTITLIIVLLVKTVLMLIILFFLKKLGRILKLQHLNLVIDSKLLNTKYFK